MGDRRRSMKNFNAMEGKVYHGLRDEKAFA